MDLFIKQVLQLSGGRVRLNPAACTAKSKQFSTINLVIASIKKKLTLCIDRTTRIFLFQNIWILISHLSFFLFLQLQGLLAANPLQLLVGWTDALICSSFAVKPLSLLGCIGGIRGGILLYYEISSGIKQHHRVTRIF